MWNAWIKKTAETVVEQHNGKHHIQVGGVQYKVRLAMDDECMEVKLHDLSENVSNDDIAANLKQYGEVHYVREQVWGPAFAYKGLPSGVRVAKMTLRRHIKSVITINSEKTLVTYKNQPKSCIHSLQPLHSGKSCTENRKAAKNTAQANGNNDRNSTIAEAISLSAPVMQNSMNQDGTSQQKANEKSKQQYKRNVRQLSPGETKPPPAKRADMKTTAETTTAHGRARD